MNDEFLDENEELDPELTVEFAGFWIRVGAAILDGLIFVPLIAFEIYNKLTLHSIPLMLLGTVLMMIYKPYLEYSRGATIGKSLVGVKVVNTEFGPLTLDQAIIRYIPWAISAILGILINFAYYNADELAESFMEIGLVTQDSFWNTFNGLYSLVFLVIVIWVAFDKRKQGLHDKIAETYCIKE